MQVRLRIGRLTLGLTVADRWECSQATGLPAWRHQDLHTSQRIGQHGITGTQTVESVIKYWSRLDQAVRICTRRLKAPLYHSPSLSDGQMTLNIQMHISWRAEKQATIWVNRRVNTLRTECQTTPRSG